MIFSIILQTITIAQMLSAEGRGKQLPEISKITLNSLNSKPHMRLDCCSAFIHLSLSLLDSAAITNGN